MSLDRARGALLVGGVRRSSRVLVVGIALLLLGVGNTWFALDKIADYEAKIAAALAAAGPSVTTPFAGTVSILEPITDERLVYERATIKAGYYRVVERGGRVFCVLGLALVLGALVRKRLVPAEPGRAT